MVKMKANNLVIHVVLLSITLLDCCQLEARSFKVLSPPSQLEDAEIQNHLSIVKPGNLVVHEEHGLMKVEKVNLAEGTLEAVLIGSRGLPSGYVVQSELVGRGKLARLSGPVKFFNQAKKRIYLLDTRKGQALAKERAERLFKSELVPLLFGFDLFRNRLQKNNELSRIYREILDNIYPGAELSSRLEKLGLFISYGPNHNLWAQDKTNYKRIFQRLFLSIFIQTHEDIVKSAILQSFTMERPWPVRPYRGGRGAQVLWPSNAAVPVDIDHYYRSWLFKDGLKTVISEDDLRDLLSREEFGRFSWENILSVAEYYPVGHENHKNDYFSKIILRLKSEKSLADEIISTYIGQIRDLIPVEEIDLVIPIPSLDSSNNQALWLVESLARIISKPISATALKKKEMNEKQKEQSNLWERMENVAGIFSASPQQVQGKKVLILDDITTSGATLDEARRVCYLTGAREVITFAFGRTTKLSITLTTSSDNQVPMDETVESSL